MPSRPVTALLSFALVILVAPLSPAAPVDFNRVVRPILAEHCFHCHGPDSATRKANLRLDLEPEAFADLGGYNAFVKGDPAASEAIARMRSDDPDHIMPPPSPKPGPSGEEIATLEAWLAQGGQWQEHWAFVAPKPQMPPQAGPGTSPIDAFLQERIAAAGLTPTPSADPYRLIRRVTLDLTGLPATPEEVAAFTADPSPAAYSQLVERLLNSPRHGEHQARYWLDAARYGDTHGLHLDNYREMWPWRDWVIRAFNANMPFDQFIVEQLAGDLLPDPTTDQLIASGFNRNNVTTSEGGAINEEYLAIYANDRVHTTMTALAGLTAGCAACHDHKFDPISQKEFYQLAAFFRNTTQPAMDGNKKDSPPVIKVPASPQDAERLAAIAAERDAASQAIADRRSAAAAAFDAWLAKPASSGAAVDAASLHLHLALDHPESGLHNLAKPGGQPLEQATGEASWLEGERGHALHIPAQPALAFPALGDFEKDQPFSYGAWVRFPDASPASAALFARMDGANGHRGWDVWLQGKDLAAHFIHAWPGDALKVTTTSAPVKPGTWQHVFVTYDGSGTPAGTRIYVDGSAQPTSPEKDGLKGSIKTTAPLTLGARSATSAPLAGGQIQDLRIYARHLSPEEVAALASHQPVLELLAKPADQRTDAEDERLLSHYLALHDAAHRTLTSQLAELATEEATIHSRHATTLVMHERADSEPTAHVLMRGEYDQPGEQVSANVPAIFPAIPEGQPNNRLGLARWFIDPAHPLLARVTVNRLWAQFFGTGLVASVDDFGAMGTQPSHPELLDYLALEFQRSGWDRRAMIRQIVTSEAYRRSAATSGEDREADPQNRLLARGPRFRLAAETIRDQALFTSGLLVESIGGPPVKPYQPPGIWEAVGYSGSNTVRYSRDSGDALYRRSIYTFWKRTAPPASLVIFDAPNRETTCLARERTNSPLQALALMNDEQQVEAARHLATRTLRDHAADADRIPALFARVAARSPSPPEQQVLASSLAHFTLTYQADPDAAAALVSYGESPPPEDIPPTLLAPWTMLASQILNLDETLNR